MEALLKCLDCKLLNVASIQEEKQIISVLSLD